MEGLDKVLLEKGYKNTKQRKIIYKVLLENAHAHLNVNEILEEARKLDNTLGIATVYRALNLFIELEMIVKVDETYEIREKDFKGICPHYICENCKKVIFVSDILDIEEDLLKKAKENDFSIHSINLNIKGICRSCKIKQKLL